MSTPKFTLPESKKIKFVDIDNLIKSGTELLQMLEANPGHTMDMSAHEKLRFVKKLKEFGETGSELKLNRQSYNVLKTYIQVGQSKSKGIM